MQNSQKLFYPKFSLQEVQKELLAYPPDPYIRFTFFHSQSLAEATFERNAYTLASATVAAAESFEEDSPGAAVETAATPESRRYDHVNYRFAEGGT